MKKTIFILNVLFIMTSPLLANPADLLTDTDIQNINKANDWCLKHKPEKQTMDGRRCSTLSSYAKYAKELATKIHNDCPSGKVER
jgi:hypothetical protein